MPIDAVPFEPTNGHRVHLRYRIGTGARHFEAFPSLLAEQPLAEPRAEFWRAEKEDAERFLVWTHSAGEGASSGLTDSAPESAAEHAQGVRPLHGGRFDRDGSRSVPLNEAEARPLQ